MADVRHFALLPEEDRIPCLSCIVPLGAGRNETGGFLPGGSAVMISRQIALTAKHVLKHYRSKVEQPSPFYANVIVIEEKDGRASFSVEIGSGFDGGAWRDSAAWIATGNQHDVAIMRLRGTDGDFPEYPEIDVLPPRAGQAVRAYGFPRAEVDEVDENTFKWITEPTVSKGMVLRICPAGRGDNVYTFPGFETTMRIEPGMSGGPVFNAEGRLCGLVAGGLSAGEAGSPDLSYVSMIYPAMTLPFQGKGFESALVGSYPLIVAGHFGIIRTANLTSLEIGLNEVGEAEQVRLIYRK